ncbi:hypothetical protein E3P78_00691 [Wallemia ichthyophaga]|nr:hypothetical protein E3P78_00691 [Wallemia ichthyophaga]
MGISHSRSFSLDSFVAEIGNDVSYDRSLGNSRFLKAIRGKSRSGRIIVKVFTKADPSVNLSSFIQRLKKEKSQLVGISNVYAFQTFLETDKAGYMIRQYIGTNLYDRVSTRPFLSTVEKKWIAFQLLCALQDSHTCQVPHGDVKSENVLVTSSNWVYLTDFASVKPSHLPLDDPSDFSLYFDTSARRTCYLAPERFFDNDSDIAHFRQLILEKGTANVDTQDKLVVTEAMDVFSAGCVIAELFLEGTPLFTLSQLLRYKEGNYNPSSVISQIDDQEVRHLITSMTQMDPSERLSFSGYLAEYRQKLFPNVFYTFLHDYSAQILEPIQQPPNSTFVAPSNTSATPFDTFQANNQIQTPNHVKYVPEERVEKLWNDWLEISSNFDEKYCQIKEELDEDDLVDGAVFPVQLSIPNVKPLLMVRKDNIDSSDGEDGAALIVSTLLCSNIRNCIKPSSKMKALELLLAVSSYLKDDTKLDRIIPYMVDLLSDASANVRASTLRNITQMLLIVGSITPANSTIFIEYLLPLILTLASDSSELVRSTLAQCIAPIAETGQKFLNLAESMKSNNTYTANEGVEKMLLDGNESFENSYETSRQDLQVFIQDIVATLLTDSSSMVKRSLLQDIIPLCLFFGAAKSNDLLLTHINTYLNDRDWELRSAFFDSVVGIATCIGGKSVEEYILPLVIQALSDAEENVIVNVLNSIRKLAELGLIKKISSIDSDSLNEAALPPLSRTLFEIAQEWSLEVPKSPFWRNGVMYQTIGLKEGLRSLHNGIYKQVPKVDTQICDDDKPYIDRMAEVGFTKEDEIKLAYLRSHISMFARAQESRSSVNGGDQPKKEDIDKVIALSDLKVAPQTVFIGLKSSNLISGTLEANVKSRSNLSKQRSIESWSKQISSISQRNTPSNEHARPQVSNRVDVMDLRKRLAQPQTSSVEPVATREADNGSRRESSTTLDTMHSTSPRMNDLAGFGNNDTSPPEPGSYAGSPTLSVVRPQAIGKRSGPLPGDGQKAAAAVGSVNTNAIGMLEVPGREAPGEEQGQNSSQTPNTGGGNTNPRINLKSATYQHTYEGGDTAILKMLDSVCRETLREPLVEFGNTLPPPLIKRRRSPYSQNDEPPSLRLVGQFNEHEGGLTCVAVSSDHVFFATGSHDHTVKIWDTARLEKNVTAKSRHTLRRSAGISAISMIENTHSLAVACRDGTVVIYRVDVSQGTTLPRYAADVNDVPVVREFSLNGASEGEYVTWMYHYSSDTSSNLVYTTSFSRLCIIDLRTTLPTMDIDGPAWHGPIVNACIDRDRTWVVTGTIFGWLALWDIRFGIMVHAWRCRNGGGITQVNMDPSSDQLVVVCVDDVNGSRTVVEVHNVATRQIVDVYESQGSAYKSNSDGLMDVYGSGSSAEAIEKLANTDTTNYAQSVPPSSEAGRSLLIGPATKRSGGIWYDFGNATGHANAQLNASGWVFEDIKSKKETAMPKKRFVLIGTNAHEIKWWNLGDKSWYKSAVLSGKAADTREYIVRQDESDARDVHYEEKVGVQAQTRRSSKETQVNEQNDRLMQCHSHSVEVLAAIELPFRALLLELYTDSIDGSTRAQPQLAAAAAVAMAVAYPIIDNSALVYDLMETRSIERTAENVLRRGRLTTPPYGFQLPSHLVVEPLSESLPNNTGNSTSSTKDTHKNLIKKYNLEDKDVDSINVNNGWGTTTGERDRQFKERKAKMILEARRKLIDKKKREVA